MGKNDEDQSGAVSDNGKDCHHQSERSGGHACEHGGFPKSATRDQREEAGRRRGDERYLDQESSGERSAASTPARSRSNRRVNTMSPAIVNAIPRRSTRSSHAHDWMFGMVK